MTPPICVTQHTSESVLGITGRRFREMVLRHRIKHVRDGKLVIVTVADWLSAMSRLAQDSSTQTNTQDSVASVDDMLAQLGRRRGVLGGSHEC